MKTGLWFDPLDTAQNSLAAATTGTGTAIAFNQCTQIIGGIEYDPLDPPTSGVLVAEWAFLSSYTGNWNGPLTQVTLADVVAGTATGSFTYPGALPFVRWRFTTDSDKPITAKLNGNIN